MADDWKSSDKLRLRDFIGLVVDDYAAAIEASETKHPSFRLESTIITQRAVLKPMTNEATGETQVWVDINDPAHFDRADIPIPITRKPGT